MAGGSSGGGAPLLMSSAGQAVPLSHLAASQVNSSATAEQGNEPDELPAKKPRKGSVAAIAAAAELKASKAAVTAANKVTKAATKKAAKDTLKAGKQAPTKRALPSGKAAKDTQKQPRLAVVMDSDSDSDSDSDMPLSKRAETWATLKAQEVKAAQGKVVTTTAPPVKAAPPAKVAPEPIVCVDCQITGDYSTDMTKFIDQGSRGIFCKDKDSCSARRVMLAGRSRGVTYLPTQAPMGEQMVVIEQVMLRHQPCLESLSNGVEVDVDEVVDVLAHSTSSTCGTSFLYISAHKRKGYIRESYCSRIPLNQEQPQGSQAQVTPLPPLSACSLPPSLPQSMENDLPRTQPMIPPFVPIFGVYSE
jgi:hypothetical protein